MLAIGLVPAVRTPEYWRAVSLLDVVLMKPYSMYPTRLPRPCCFGCIFVRFFRGCNYPLILCICGRAFGVYRYYCCYCYYCTRCHLP